MIVRGKGFWVALHSSLYVMQRNQPLELVAVVIHRENRWEAYMPVADDKLSRVFNKNFPSRIAAQHAINVTLDH